MTLEDVIAATCLKVGIPAHIQGNQFIQYGIRMLIDEPEVINQITKELYPRIAERFRTTASKVERSIRHAIGIVWEKERAEVINQEFGFTVCTQDCKPSNGEFVALMAQCCKKKYNETRAPLEV